MTHWTNLRGRCLCFLALLLAEEYYALDDRYFYARHSSGNEFVKEHIAPESQPLKLGDRPPFLYWEHDQGYRVVNFYVDYCMTCQGLVPEYIQLAKILQPYNVSVHAVSCMMNKHLCLRLNIAGYPVIRLFNPGETALNHHYDLSVSDLHPHKVLEYFRIPFHDPDQKMLIKNVSSLGSSLNKAPLLQWQDRVFELFSQMWSNFFTTNTANMGYSYKRNETEIESDVHRSFDLIMRTGVFLPQQQPSSSSSSSAPQTDGDEEQLPLSEQAQTVLFTWLKLLDKTLPTTWHSMHALIEELSSNFNYAVKSENYLVSFLDRNPPNRSEWSLACSHGIPNAGYSCGLWTLFHAVTVGAVEFNKMALKRNRLATEVVARQIRDFVQQFYTCQVCKTHFVASFDACDHHRCELLSSEISEDADDWLQLPLWLARVHNAVNVRRAEADQQRKQSIQLFGRGQSKSIPSTSTMWPSRTDCSQCWGPSEDGEWIEDAVYHYLKVEFFSGYREEEPPAEAAAPNHNEIRVYHLGLSCLLVGLAFGVWDTTRWCLRRIWRSLTHYTATKDQ